MTARTMIGSAKLRNWSTTPARTAAWCRRRPSDVIAGTRELRNLAANTFGFRTPKRRNLRRAGGSVERDARQVEERLQHAAFRVDVLHPADRHECAPDRPQPGAQIDLVVANVVAPAP